MCNYYDAKFPAKRLNTIAGAEMKLPLDYEPRHKIFPTGISPIIRIDSEGKTIAEVSHFKLVPDFADGLYHKYSTMNARDDSLLKKGKMWNRYFEEQRCLVPATAFYEHHTLSDKKLIEGYDKPTNKVPYRISLKSSDLFCFAGIWNEWTDPETGEVKLSHAIITTEPNETVRKIHNSKERMALILPETADDIWIGQVQKGDDLFDAGLFQSWPDEVMQFFQISKGFDHGISDESLLEPVKHAVEL